MYKRLPVKQKIELIKRVQAGEKVVQVCREAGISRTVFYQWQKQYAGVGPRAKKKVLSSKVVRGKKHWKRLGPDKEREVIKLALKKPGLSPGKMSQLTGVSQHGVWRVLKRNDLNTLDKREVYIEQNGASLIRPLGVTDKVVMMRRFEQGEGVAGLCREFGISRATFYKWLKRYQEAGVKRQGLESLRPRDEKHWRFIPGVREAVLGLVVKQPELSAHKIAARLEQVGSHGVHKILKREGLSRYEQRLRYAEGRVEEEVFPRYAWFFNRIKLVWDKFITGLAPAPPPWLKYFFASFLLTMILGIGVGSWVWMIGQTTSVNQSIGLIFSSIALTMGSIFFIYSLKYYLTLAIVLSYSQREGERERGERKRGLGDWLLGMTIKEGHQGPIGLEPDLKSIRLRRKPMVSVHIPFYNEKKVVERAIEAATSFDYPEYEVLLLDDSTDETPEMIRKIQKRFLRKGKKLRVKRGSGWVLTTAEGKQGVILKHLHRTSRAGFKGGALGQGLKLTNPKAEFVVVFDADFVPYPDTLELFVKYFKAQNQMSENYQKSNVAVVQGYQWHVLNKSENWITRGVRSEYSGSYVIERSGAEIYGGLKQISGAVYMIRRDVLDELGWQTSITEDFQLTLRLYEKGYKVVYTPYIQAPAECVSTLKRLIRQRMRWAEGHSQNIKKMFLRLMRSDKLTTAEKLETLYLSPYYLQAFFFLLGTLSWLMAETVFPARLPFWTVLWGWSLVLTNMISLPLMNVAGMFLEESEERDYLGLASFFALSYIVVPFQAYAAFKGFLEKEEGPWFRTPKTGKITDVFKRGTFYRFISGILPGKPATEVAKVRVRPAFAQAFANKYLALETANNRFDGFRIKPKRMRWVSKVVLAVLLAFTVTVYSATKGVMIVEATDPAGDMYYFDPTVPAIGGFTLKNSQDGLGTGTQEKITATENTYFYTEVYPTDTGDASYASGTWTVEFNYSSAASGSKWVTFDVEVLLCDDAGCPTASAAICTAVGVTCGGAGGSGTCNSTATPLILSFTDCGSGTIEAADPKRIAVHFNGTGSNQGGSVMFDYDSSADDSNLTTTGIDVPEKVVYFLVLAPLIPMAVLWLKKREGSGL